MMRTAVPETPRTQRTHLPYRLGLSTVRDDPLWDEFLLDVGGSHTQASAWAQVKASLGWETARVLARADGRIVGGAQLLIRRVPGLGAIGYIANGPVVAHHDEALVDLLVGGVRDTARRLRIRHVTVQPPRDGDAVAASLARRGCLPSTTRVTPTATLLLDLSGGAEQVLARMSARTRYNARLGARRGVVIREGTEADLTTYGRLLRATGERQRFTPLPQSYFAAMWEVLQPRGQLRFVVAEVDGEVVAAQLAVAFGDTVTNKMSVWSGEHGANRPNEAVQWSTIRWAADNGYRWYDLEGIDPDAARRLLAGDALPDGAKRSVTSYKLGFGGRVVVLPPAYDDLYNPLLRAAFARTFPLVRDHRVVRRLVKRARSRQHGTRAPRSSP